MFVERGIKARVGAGNTNIYRHQGLKGKNIKINITENGVLSMFFSFDNSERIEDNNGLLTNK